MGRADRRLRDFGPVQLARRLDLWQFQVARGLADGLIPGPDVDGGRWSAGVVEELAGRAEEIRGAVGSIPDVGAVRSAIVLSERFGRVVHADAVAELARRGAIRCVGEYRDAPLYDGRAMETFDDRAALADALHAGRCLISDEAAEYLKVRRADFDHLGRAGLLTPTRWVRSSWPRRPAPRVALYRVDDLDELAANDAVDWAAVRATPAGRRSPLAGLPDADDDRTEGAR